MPLDIYLHSEQKYDELIQVLVAVHKYIPFVKNDSVISVNNTDYCLSRDVVSLILLGGDQLTAARCRGCKLIRLNATCISKRLAGFYSVVEDWHAKVALLEVFLSLKIMY